MTMARRLVLLAVAAGVIVGAVVAAAVPRSRAAHVHQDTLLALPGSLHSARALRPLPGAGRFRVHRGSLRTELTVRDPAGGPAWRVRMFVADRLVPSYARRPGTSGIAGVSMCAQLGRLVDGRFGWIDASNTFRPEGFAYDGGPTLCGSRIPDRRHMPSVEARTLITDPAMPDPQIRGMVVWGAVGARVKDVAIRLGGREVHPHRSARGAFLAFAGPALHQRDVAITVGYPDGASKHVRFGHSSFPAFERGRFARPIPGTARLEARAPDPGGGPSFGILTARGSRGGWCFGNAEQIVGDRLGQIDRRVGSLYEDDGSGPGMSCQDPRLKLTRERPVQYGLSGAEGFSGDEIDPARPLLRTLRGRISIYGITRPDVKLITISTPRDVRTLVPSARAHAFIAVYDGDFPSGQIAVTATFRDGKRVTQTERAGF
jgi:hypothetical protein